MRGSTWLVGLSVLAAGCGSDSTNPSNPPPGNGSTVSVDNLFFAPIDLSVLAGTQVTWQWVADAVNHNVTFADGPASQTQNSGTFQRTFSTPGTFPYMCTIHGPGMHGTITVTAAASRLGGTGRAAAPAAAPH